MSRIEPFPSRQEESAVLETCAYHHFISPVNIPVFHRVWLQKHPRIGLPVNIAERDTPLNGWHTRDKIDILFLWSQQENA